MQVMNRIPDQNCFLFLKQSLRWPTKAFQPHTKMSPPNFRLAPCEFSDLAECVDVFNEAFVTDPNFVHFHPRSDPKVTKAHDLKGYEKSFKKPWVKYFKIEDEENGYVLSAFRNLYSCSWIPNPTFRTQLLHRSLMPFGEHRRRIDVLFYRQHETIDCLKRQLTRNPLAARLPPSVNGSIPTLLLQMGKRRWKTFSRHHSHQDQMMIWLSSSLQKSIVAE